MISSGSIHRNELEAEVKCRLDNETKFPSNPCIIHMISYLYSIILCY